MNTNTIMSSIKLSFSHFSRVEADGQHTHYINWPIETIPTEVYNNIAHAVKKSTNFGAELPKGFCVNLGLSPDVLAAIRAVVLKQKIISNIPRLLANIVAIDRAYDTTDVTVISKKYNIAPLSILRKVLEYRGIFVQFVFAGSQHPKEVLNGRDLAQYKLAVSADAENIYLQQYIARVAADNENTFVDFFKGLGIGLRTQDELTVEQMKTHGRAVNTPDILFTDAVYINGTRIHWIDYKDYVATRVPFLYNSNVKQATRYVAEWGDGGLCYHYGAVSNTTIPHTVMLSTKVLPIKLEVK